MRTFTPNRGSFENYAEQLIRILDLKGDIPGGSLAEGWGVSFQVDDLAAPEYRWLRRERRYANGDFLAASPGNFGTAEFFLSTAVTAGAQLAIVEQLVLNNENAATMSYNIGLRNIPNVNAFVLTQIAGVDDRQQPYDASPINYSASFLFAVAAAATQLGLSTGQSLRVTVPPGGSVILPIPYVVSGRGVLRIVTGAVNQILSVGISWRERVAAPGER